MLSSAAMYGLQPNLANVKLSLQLKLSNVMLSSTKAVNVGEATLYRLQLKLSNVILSSTKAVNVVEATMYGLQLKLSNVMLSSTKAVNVVEATMYGLQLKLSNVMLSSTKAVECCGVLRCTDCNCSHVVCTSSSRSIVWLYRLQ